MTLTERIAQTKPAPTVSPWVRRAIARQLPVRVTYPQPTR